ncbi:zinc finger protein 346 [Gadus morhua]|uniref:Zinc finger protein 346 n=1 Tax=Gadus morhua TaxID=8049 RepID=A0A8C5APW0_GADMO|nr:zinc finger protein 346 [Gadus morhua]
MRIGSALCCERKMAVAMQMEDFPYLPSGPAEVNKMIKEHSDLFSDSQCKVCSAVLISESQKLTHYQSKKHANKVRRYLCIQNDKEPSLKKFKPESSVPDSACNNGEAERYKLCNLCNMTFSSAVMAQSHYQGKVHAKNLRLKTVGPQTAAPQATATAPQPKKSPSAAATEPRGAGAAAGTAGTGDPDRFCSICEASFNNPLMAQQHYAGKKHKKQLTKQKLMETYGPSTSPGQAGCARHASTVKGYSCTLCNIDLNSVEQYQAHISGAKHKNQMKKSGMGSTENQHKTTQNQFPAGDYLAADGANQFSTGDYQSVDMGDQFSTGDYQSVAPGNEYSGGSDPYIATEHQYMSEGNQYSTGIPECQYT